MRRTKGPETAAKALPTQQSVDAAVKSICDVMRRGNCAGAMQYVPELTWILFLRILDETEADDQERHEALNVSFRPSLEAPYRWRDWAAPDGTVRRELVEKGSGQFLAFVNGTRGPGGDSAGLLPYLKGLRDRPGATPRQRVISEVMGGVERVRMDTEKNLLDVLDKVHEISARRVDTTHVFALSQVYEGLLLKMGEKGNDGGQFFTPREVIRAMVRVVAPRLDETVYDPCCGTGGFLAQTYEYMRERLGPEATGEHVETLKQHTFFGREKENLVYPIALANLVLHGIDLPHLWHGNTLTDAAAYAGLFEGAPQTFGVILTNPPFGGREGKEAQTNFDYHTGATQVLFLQHVIRRLAAGGRCGIVLDEGLLFRTNEEAFVKTKRKLLDDCDVHCIVSLPGGVFTAAGAGVKTNLVFFTKGKRTQKIWYYDLTDIKVRKRSPLTLRHFDDFLQRLPERADSEASWTVDFAARRQAAAEQARPFRTQAEVRSRDTANATERLKALRKAVPRDDAAIAAAEREAKGYASEARQLAAKAQEIEDAIYDLKAVNPHRQQTVDARTPEDLLAIIEAKSSEIAQAVARLRQRPGTPDPR